MTRRSRRNHTGTFKAKVALEAIKGEKTLLELASQHDVHANQITQWKSQLLEGAAGVFGEARTDQPAPVDLKTLHAKIGELTLENDFLEGGAHQGGTSERQKMIDPQHDLPLKKQAEALAISRSSAYYRGRPVPAADLWRMRCIDALHRRVPSELSLLRVGAAVLIYTIQD